MIPAPILPPFNGKAPLAPHEVHVDPGDGIPSITLTRFETGQPETYHLLPDAVTVLIAGLIGTASPPPGEVWCVVKANPRSMTIDGGAVQVTLAGVVRGEPDPAATVAWLRERAVQAVVKAGEACTIKEGPREPDGVFYGRLMAACYDLARVVDEPDAVLAEYIESIVKEAVK